MKSVNITKNVSKCYDCPYVTNSSIEHDCAFTSAPINTRWWCKHNLGPMYIKNEYEIHEKCPFVE